MALRGNGRFARTRGTSLAELDNTGTLSKTARGKPAGKQDPAHRRLETSSCGTATNTLVERMLPCQIGAQNLVLIGTGCAAARWLILTQFDDFVDIGSKILPEIQTGWASELRPEGPLWVDAVEGEL